ncbi:MAG: DUF1127 domain-containing protein [Gammaproteobacteria bacterium]|nr:DUF1127 domain-containing protein [Gammaproteobacteria bacterium]
MLYCANQLYQHPGQHHSQHLGATEALRLSAATLCRSSFSLSKVIRRLLKQLAVWHERASSRRRLADLDERMLRDIGLDRATAGAEANKPFWTP